MCVRRFFGKAKRLARKFRAPPKPNTVNTTITTHGTDPLPGLFHFVRHCQCAQGTDHGNHRHRDCVGFVLGTPNGTNQENDRCHEHEKVWKLLHSIVVLCRVCLWRNHELEKEDNEAFVRNKENKARIGYDCRISIQTGSLSRNRRDNFALWRRLV